jgi:hypothetical protein
MIIIVFVGIGFLMLNYDTCWDSPTFIRSVVRRTLAGAPIRTFVGTILLLVASLGQSWWGALHSLTNRPRGLYRPG